MKIFLISISVLFYVHGSGQIVNDTIPRPVQNFFPCMADSVVSESHSDSVNYVLKTPSVDQYCQAFLCAFDSTTYYMELGIYEPQIYIVNSDSNQLDFQIISFFEDMKNVKQIYTRKGSKVTKISFSLWGHMVTYFECDYSVCDQCISEGYGPQGKEGYNETIYFTPITCVQDLDWIKLKPEYKELSAIPVRMVINEGAKCLVDRPIQLLENYIN